MPRLRQGFARVHEHGVFAHFLARKAYGGLDGPGEIGFQSHDFIYILVKSEVGQTIVSCRLSPSRRLTIAITTSASTAHEKRRSVPPVQATSLHNNFSNQAARTDLRGSRHLSS